MHITVDHLQLKRALELMVRVTTKHVTLPVLQCVLLESKDGKLTLTATNLEIGVTGTITASETEGGVVAVFASILLQTVALITQKEVTLKTEEGVLLVETPASRTKINTVSSGEFPSIPHISEKPQKINGKRFAVGIKTAAFAASQSSIKPELGSVYIFQKKEHTLSFVATDSFRLVEKTLAQQNVVFDEGIMIPQKNALELAYLCDHLEDDPNLMVTENQCALIFEGFYITSRLTSGSFPDYEQIIPKEYITHTTTLTRDLQNTLKKTNIFLNKFLQVSLKAEATSLTFEAQNSEVGTTKETIPATTEGGDITLSFNQRYINEIVPHMTDESVTMHFAGVGRPMVMEGVHDRSLRYLVMPMNK